MADAGMLSGLLVGVGFCKVELGVELWMILVVVLTLVVLVHRQPLDGCCLRHGRFCVGVFHPAIIAGGCRSCRQGVANRAIPLKIRRFSATCARARFRRQDPPAGFRAVCSVKEGLDFFPWSLIKHNLFELRHLHHRRVRKLFHQRRHDSLSIILF